MADNSELAGLGAAAAAQAPNASRARQKDPVFSGEFAHNGTKFGVNGATPVARAAAIAAPTAPSAAYSQAEAQSMKTAVDALRTAIKNAGITL
jgi:hypothetical protein